MASFFFLKKIDLFVAFDFEKYINQIIPPDLFDLYFFDGEKIADFFLDDGSKVRLKNAFLTLCGYDTFVICGLCIISIFTFIVFNERIVP